jgi:pyruvate dehydrogenase E1 component
LQHQDGQSHLLASPVPNLVSYDPAYAYELAEIVRAGIERMHVRNEDVFYYLTVGNEAYAQPAMPEGDGVREGIVRGMYLLRPAPDSAPADAPRVHLLASGAILNEAVDAQTLLLDQFGIAAEVWSVTSWTELRRDGLDVERWNMLHPTDPPRVPWVTQQLDGHGGAFVAASDYMKALPDGIAKWVPGTLATLGTDGFGRSASRAELHTVYCIHQVMCYLMCCSLLQAA